MVQDSGHLTRPYIFRSRYVDGSRLSNNTANGVQWWYIVDHYVVKL